MLMFPFSREKRSKIIKDSFSEFIPYKTPRSLDSSALVKGKVVAREVLSMFLVIDNLSMPNGAEERNPFSWSRVACLATIIKDPKVDSTCLVNWFSSSTETAGIVI